MWLPKDEIKTLRKYHSYIYNIGKSAYFTDISERAHNATRKLIERGLILDVKESGEGFIACQIGDPVSLKDFLSFCEEDEIRQEAVLKFTLEGLDLVNEYDSRWLYIKLWYEKYIKNHPILLIISFIVGVIVTLLVNWLSSFFGAK